MQDDAWLMFSEQVSCEDYCHLDGVVLEQPMAPTQLHRLADRNLNALAAIAALEERHAETDDDSPVMLEIQRMDAKLTALVDMVNHLLVPGSSLPPRQWLRFNALGAVLAAASVPAGELVLLRLRFDVCRGLPVELPARVERRLDDDQVFLAFVSQGDVVSDAIERLVFRHHRRKVAEARQLTE
jgi:hypothetical protein